RHPSHQLPLTDHHPHNGVVSDGPDPTPAGPDRVARARAEVVRRGAGVSAIVWLGFAAFVGLGMPEATLGVTWPSIRADFDRPLGSLGILLVALTLGYLPSSLLSGHVVARLGPGRMLAAASAIYVVALGLYA